MTESSWESSRKTQKKRLVAGCLIAIPLMIIGAILYLNNRDYFSSAAGFTPMLPKQTGDSVAQSMLLGTLPPPVSSPTTEDTVKQNKVKPESPDKPIMEKKHVTSTVSRNNMQQTFTSVVEAPGVPDQKAPSNTVVNLTESSVKKTNSSERYSIEITEIPCQIESRKDLAITLSLELFFEDASDQLQLLIRREDLKVMVMLAVRKNELSEMKKELLESQLLKSTNSIFERPVITAVAVRSINVEKVHIP